MPPALEASQQWVTSMARRQKKRPHTKAVAAHPVLSQKISRLAVVDFLRGLALIAMTVFHFIYDLEFFGLKELGYSDQFHWWFLAITVAGSFLFLSGVSLYLAHAHRIHWKPWARRIALIAFTAIAITVITSFITPARYINFGILHMIAAAGVIGLAFLRIPWWLTAAAAVAILAIDHTVTIKLLDVPALSWLGFVSQPPVASDFRPIFPWLAPALFGIATTKMCHQGNWLEVLATPRLDHLFGRSVQFIGRHSLIYYLLHQPILFALFWAWLWLAP